MTLAKYCEKSMISFLPNSVPGMPMDIILYMEALANNMLDHKAIRGIIITCRDVTERREAERQLRESEEKFRIIFETALDGIFMMQGDRFVDCNSAVLKMFGCYPRTNAGQASLLFFTRDSA